MILGPQSVIEKILADALDKEGIPYECQYRVYDKLNDLQPRYMLDFCVKVNNKLIGVECDGEAYHRDKQRDMERSAYLYSKGIAIVLRFTTSDIKYDIDYCVNEIKRYINMYADKKYVLKKERGRRFKEKKVDAWVRNNENRNLPYIELYAVGYALSYEQRNYGVAMTMLVDKTTNQQSQVRYELYTNTTQKECDAKAILQGLQRINRPCMVCVYTTSKWLCNVCNQNQLLFASKNIVDKSVFVRIEDELKNHDYHFVFVEKNPEGMIQNAPYRELNSRAKQVLYNQKRSDMKEKR